MPVEYRRCRTCAVEKPLDDFYPDKYRALGRRYVCKVCELAEAASPKARAGRRLTSAERYRRGRAILTAMKDRPCADCGGRFPPCAMDFDHPDPKVKMFEIGRWAGGGITPKLLEEIAKCDLVCACCHRIRTERQFEMGILKRRGRPRKQAVNE